ncbi:MAG: hypothetical protein KAG34_10495, partial [Cocleimonas sp.]|nr:hypothetical protein [Cocleimonas sp.]
MRINNTLKIGSNSLFKVIVWTLSLLFSSSIYAEEKIVVGLTPDMPYAEVKHKGSKVRIKRIQNELNKLTDNFSKTSRPCPPFCIAPIEAAPNVKTVGELELIRFLQQDTSFKKGLLIDARLAKFYGVETIPGAINIPFTLFT